jgi:hypothetical protein
MFASATTRQDRSSAELAATDELDGAGVIAAAAGEVFNAAKSDRLLRSKALKLSSKSAL